MDETLVNMKKIRLFHRTSSASATAILRRGFRDGYGKYMTDTSLFGVWLSDRILDANDGAHGDRVLVLDVVLSGSELDFYEVKEEGKTGREWLMPASILNSRGRIVAVERE